MTAFGDSDLAYITGDVLSVPVVFGAQSTRGIKSEGDHVVNDAELGSVVVRATTVAIKAGSLTGLTDDAAIKVDGVSCKIRNFGPVDDGQVTMIQLAEA